MAVKTYVQRNPRVIFGPDDFSNGPCGWTHINNGNTFTAPLLPASYPSIDGPSLQLTTEDGTPVSGVPWNYAMAIKRGAYPFDATKVRFDLHLSIAAPHSGSPWSGPRNIDIGLDTGYSSATGSNNNRAFYRLRYLINDEAATGPNMRFQVSQGGLGIAAASTFTDCVAADGTTPITYPLGYNENKRDPMHIQLEVNLANRTYLGMSVNGIGYGSMATTPDNTFSSLGTASIDRLTSGGYATFYGGFNASVEVYNRTNSALSKTKVFIMSPKVEVIA